MKDGKKSPSLEELSSEAVTLPKVQEVSLAFIIGPSEEWANSLRTFLASTAHRAQALLSLVALHASEGYHRSAYQILSTNISELSDTGTRDSLLIIIDTMLKGTFKIGALEINRSIRELVLQHWPDTAARLPRTEAEVVGRYAPSFQMGYGELVNKLRSTERTDFAQVVSLAQANASQVVEDLFRNKVYGWVVTFLDQSRKYKLMSAEEYQVTLVRLDRELSDADSTVCRWHRDALIPSAVKA